jgi:hypothetical protein
MKGKVLRGGVKSPPRRQAGGIRGGRQNFFLFKKGFFEKRTKNTICCGQVLPPGLYGKKNMFPPNARKKG